LRPRSRAATDGTHVVVVALIVRVHVAVVEVDVPRVVGIVLVGSRRPVVVRLRNPRRLFPSEARTASEGGTRVSGPAATGEDSLVPRPRYGAPALTSPLCISPALRGRRKEGEKPPVGEGPHDHGTLGSAISSRMTRRFWPRPRCWLFSQPSFCLAMSVTRLIPCSNELKFGNACASWHRRRRTFSSSASSRICSSTAALSRRALARTISFSSRRPPSRRRCRRFPHLPLPRSWAGTTILLSENSATRMPLTARASSANRPPALPKTGKPIRGCGNRP